MTQPQDGEWYQADDEKWYQWPDPTPHDTSGLPVVAGTSNAPAMPETPNLPLWPPQTSGGKVVRGDRQFAFTGGAATYFGTGLLALLITVCTLGICYPFALVLRERWRCKHAFINGQQMQFTGLGIGLFGLWIKWLLLSVITLGIYLLWVGPRIQRWKWEHTSFVGHVVAVPATAGLR